MTLNINGVKDDFYRYKMPALKIQSMNNNTTVLINIDVVAKSLNRSIHDILTFLKKKLNTGGDVKKMSLSGIWSKDILQSTLQHYINKYVLCKICGNPETELLNNYMICKACSNKTKITI